MKRVSAAWRAETHRRVIAPAACRIVLGMVDVDAAANAAVSAADSAPHSAPQTLFAAAPPVASFASLEPGRMKLDGTQRVAPSPKSAAEAKANEGYSSQSVSDAQGRFDAAAYPRIVFGFTNRHTVPSLTFTFDAVCAWWPSRLLLRAWRGTALLCEETLCPNAAVYVHRAAVELFDRMELTFLESGMPFRRARLQRLMFGEGLIFTGQQLQSVTRKSVTDPACRRISEGSVKFTLVNRNPLTGDAQQMYHPDNPTGVWRFIELHSPLCVEYGQTLTGRCTWAEMALSDWHSAAMQPYTVYQNGGMTEWIPGGTYRLSARPSADGLYAHFEAADALSLLTDLYCKGVYAPEGATLYDLAQQVLQDAAQTVYPQDTTPWRLWDGLRGITTTAPLPCRTHRECLQLIAHASGCCALQCDRDGAVCILPAAGEACAPIPPLQLPLGLQTTEPKAEKTQPLAAVRCAAYTYTPRAETTQLHKAAYTVGATGTVTLQLRYQSAANVSAVLTEVNPAGSVTLQSFTAYAGAAKAVLAGSGTATLLVQGQSLQRTSAAVTTSCADPAQSNAVIEEADNPLVTDMTRAAEVAAYTLDSLRARTAYTLSTAGHPEADALDILRADTLFTKACPVQVLQHTVQYDGALRSTFITKRRDSFAEQ